MSRFEFQKNLQFVLGLGKEVEFATFNKKLVTKFWPCQVESWFFRRGSSYFLEDSNNCIELPDISTHKAT